MSKRVFTKMLLAVCGLLCAIASYSCGNSLRTGEIAVYKGTTRKPILETDRSASVFVMRGRGFSTSENAYRIADELGGYDSAGPLTIENTLSQLQQEIKRVRLERIAKKEDQDPNRTALESLQKDIDALSRRIEAKKETTGYQDAKAAEKQMIRFSQAMLMARDFLENLDTAVSGLQEDWSKWHKTGRPEFKSLDLVFEIGRAPLLPLEDWGKVEMKADLDATKKGVQQGDMAVFVPPGRFYRYFEPFHEKWNSVKGLLDRKGYQKESAEVSERLNDFAKLLLFTIEDSLNLNRAVDKKWYKRRDRKGLVFLRTKKSAGEAYTPQSFETAFARIRLNIDKARLHASEIISVACRTRKDLMKDKDYADMRVRLEDISKRVAILSNKNIFHKLQPDTHVTFMLKTLYLCYLQEPSLTADQTIREPKKLDTEILVTCAVTHSKNADQVVYPIIFEQNYAPSFFVNRVDRFIYGPSPYGGEAFDLRFSVLELDNLNNQAIKNGFASMTAAVSFLNPEYAALAPAVSALFGSILETATENDMELDFSFTIPPPEGKGKPDIDFLIAETGHYIILKTENEFRDMPGIAEAQRRSLYRRLIYNPEDGKLYWRRNYLDNRENFTEENLFLDQSYAVLVVTDEYTRSDNLGDLLRKQIARTVGEVQSREILPSAEQVQGYIDSYKRAIGQTEEEIKKGRAFDIDPQIAQRFVDDQKDKLWLTSSPLQQQLAVEVLFSKADEGTRTLLGKDAEKWKKARLVVKDNLVHAVGDVSPTVLVLSLSTQALGSRGNETKDIFPLLLDKTGSRFVLSTKDGMLAKEDSHGKIDATNGAYSPPDTPDSAYVLASAYRQESGELSLHHQKEIWFSAEPFQITDPVDGLSIDGSSDRYRRYYTYRVAEGDTQVEFAISSAAGLEMSGTSDLSGLKVEYEAASSKVKITYPSPVPDAKEAEVWLYPTRFEKIYKESKYVPVIRITLKFPGAAGS